MSTPPSTPKRNPRIPRTPSLQTPFATWSASPKDHLDTLSGLILFLLKLDSIKEGADAHAAEFDAIIADYADKRISRHKQITVFAFLAFVEEYVNTCFDNPEAFDRVSTHYARDVVENCDQGITFATTSGDFQVFSPAKNVSPVDKRAATNELYNTHWGLYRKLRDNSIIASERLKEHLYKERFILKWHRLPLPYKAATAILLSLCAAVIVYAAVFCPPATLLLPVLGKIAASKLLYSAGTTLAASVITGHVLHTKKSRHGVFDIELSDPLKKLVQTAIHDAILKVGIECAKARFTPRKRLNFDDNPAENPNPTTRADTTESQHTLRTQEKRFMHNTRNFAGKIFPCFKASPEGPHPKTTEPDDFDCLSVKF